MIYQFQKGNTFRGIEPQTAGEELERIRKQSGGKLRTEDVLRSARSSRSPLHNAFTWDNEKAAHEYRMKEARFLIRSVVIIEKEEGPLVPAFWNVIVASAEASEESEQYYQAAVVLSSSPQEYSAALKGMLSKLSNAQASLEQLRQLAPKREQPRIARASKHVELAEKALA